MPQRAKYTRLLAAYIFCALPAAACSRQQLGLPRVPVEARSPDGQWLAYVRNHPSVDPPRQSLWLKGARASTKIAELGEDVDWCNSIVWNADGSVVAFVIQDARALVVRAADGTVLADRWLVRRTGSYPPERVVKDVRLADSGRGATYVSCDRRNGDTTSSSSARAQELYDQKVSDCTSEAITF